MTNADMIRNMSDEELAEFLWCTDHYCTGDKCIVVLNSEKINDTLEDIKKWLER